MASIALDTVPDSREALVLRYRRLARRLAQRYVRDGDQREDLEQVAYLGLVKAAQRFDPHRGTAFTSFAMPTVLGELRRYCRDTRWALHVPRGTQERVQALCRFDEAFASEHSRSPSQGEAARALGWPEEDVLEARLAATTLSPQSLDAPVETADGRRAQLMDKLGGEDAGYDGAERRDVLRRALAELSPRTRRALWLRTELGLTVPEVARHLGLSAPQTARLIGAALRQLRATLEARPAASHEPAGRA